MPYFGSKALEKLFNSFSINIKENSVALGWGRKTSYFKAKKFADKHGINCICLEDGFIRSLGLGKDGYDPLSLVVDQTGIYFDAFQASDLEQLIQAQESLEFSERARVNINKIKAFSITKYNQKFIQVDEDLFQSGKNILVVDQTYGDQSIKYSGASPESFRKSMY